MEECNCNNHGISCKSEIYDSLQGCAKKDRYFGRAQLDVCRADNSYIPLAEEDAALVSRKRVSVDADPSSPSLCSWLISLSVITEPHEHSIPYHLESSTYARLGVG